MTRTERQENIVYLIIIGVVLIIPVMVSIYQDAVRAIDFSWMEIWKVWLRFLPFILLFAIHNWLLTPLFLRGKHGLYYSLTGLLVLLFTAYLFFRPKPELDDRPVSEWQMTPPPALDDKQEWPEPDVSSRPAPDAFRRPEPPVRDKRPLGPLSPGVLLFLLGLSVLGGNWAIKSYFLSVERRQQLEQLEKDNLDFQLAYLRYQINPHFFMNTLNNIHALVDIDPEKAKESIVELSKLMRYILYEGSKPTIPLDKETAFLRQYISLMRMRYSDSVVIDVELPDSVPGAEVPPLVFVSFVENAFKHGISYERDSYIRVSMTVENGRLIFKCSNSRHESTAHDEGGVGMENVRRRLELLYGDRFVMNVEQRPDHYDILLIIPIDTDL